MSLKTKVAFDLAAKLPNPITLRDLEVMRVVMEYMAQHFIDVVENYDEEKENHQQPRMN